MASKTTYHHGDLRRALLAAAEEELSEKGVEAFSLRGVAKRAGVSHGAPAHHFDDARGLLTELAAQGYRRFISAQERRQREAPMDDAEAQLAAAGLGYIDFAKENPALFRLMFSSERPDKSSNVLADAADSAFEKLVDDTRRISTADPHSNQLAMNEVMATWAIAHGLADLLISDRLERFLFLSNMTPAERDAVFSQVILRASKVKSA